MKFDIISIAFLVIISLFIILGLRKGFFKSLISLIKNVAALLISIFLCEPIATLLNNTKMGSALASKIETLFTGDIFNTTLTEENMGSVVSQALQNIKVPEKLSDLLSSLVSRIIPAGEQSCTVGHAIANALSYYIFVVISFFVLFLIARLLIKLLDGLFESLEQIPFVGLLNKLLGAVLNGFIGVLFVCLISYLFTILIPLNNGLSEWLVKTMNLNNPDVFTFSKYLYEHNILLEIIALIQKLFH